MEFAWLKNYMPRSLYGRAALILLVPVVTLQLVVSVVFIQRHFEGVTRQMTRNLAFSIDYLLDVVDEAPDLATATTEIERLSGPLDLEVVLPGTPPGAETRVWYDISGLTVIATLRELLPGLTGVDLGRTSRDIAIGVETAHGLIQVNFDRRRVVASNPHQLLVLMVAAGALMTVISILFLRNQLRPIRRLSRVAEAFGKGHTLPFRPTGAAEVRLAGQAFLDMRARIERQMEQRTLLLSGVSHDLRTPLTRMKLELSMFDETPEKEALEMDVSEMQRMIDSFLGFVRDDALDDVAQTDPVALAEEIAQLALRAGRDVEYLGAEGAGTAMLRPDAIRRALDNLLGNAVRYGTRATLAVAVTERAVRFTIEDDGPGIPADQREEALKPFQRLDSSRNQDKGSGAGLGLAIAQDIARRHGGALRMGVSEELGGLRVDLVLAR